MFSTIDPRDRELARLIVNYSVKAGKNDLVMIEAVGASTLGLAAACAEEATRASAAPYIVFTDPQVQRNYLLNAGEDSMKRLAEFELLQMKNTTCYIGLRGSENIYETADVPKHQLDNFMRIIRQPVHLDVRVNHTRWCVLRYPNPSMAQLAERSTADFADFYYSVCLVDYARMAVNAQALKKVMERTDRVRLKSPGTDITFSIKGIPVVPCCGSHNIPDGECFTAPVKGTMNGTVQFNTPTAESGTPYDNIFLRFENGRVVECRGANERQTKKLTEVLDRDEGARAVGEFAIGFNPLVMTPMRDILFDEKICGSFHMALGNAYNDADNGNRSSLHWDLVCIQRPDYGGGEIWFDDTLIRKDGEFVIDELKGLNPSALT
ncbi:MAG: aminopeptidase [Candidatus Sumerlaeota bacterium]|nr:aminopeptidase [Candidatus Sumerlaeota bacterium]